MKKSIAKLCEQDEIKATEVLSVLDYYVGEGSSIGRGLLKAIKEKKVAFSDRQKLRLLNLAKRGLIDHALRGYHDSVKEYVALILYFDPKHSHVVRAAQ